MGATLEVNCSVSECYFWKQSNLCGAQSIWVRKASAPLSDERMDASGEFLAPSQAGPFTSEDTCCQTFKPRKNG